MNKQTKLNQMNILAQSDGPFISMVIKMRQRKLHLIRYSPKKKIFCVSVALVARVALKPKHFIPHHFAKFSPRLFMN